jgi:hypothetical protein
MIVAHGSSGVIICFLKCHSGGPRAPRVSIVAPIEAGNLPLTITNEIKSIGWFIHSGGAATAAAMARMLHRANFRWWSRTMGYVSFAKGVAGFEMV